MTQEESLEEYPALFKIGLIRILIYTNHGIEQIKDGSWEQSYNNDKFSIPQLFGWDPRVIFLNNRLSDVLARNKKIKKAKLGEVVKRIFNIEKDQEVRVNGGNFFLGVYRSNGILYYTSEEDMNSVIRERFYPSVSNEFSQHIEHYRAGQSNTEMSQ